MSNNIKQQTNIFKNYPLPSLNVQQLSDKVHSLINMGYNRTQIAEIINNRYNYRDKRGNKFTALKIADVLPPEKIRIYCFDKYYDELEQDLASLYKAQNKVLKKAKNNILNTWVSREEILIFGQWLQTYYGFNYQKTSLRKIWLYHKNHKNFQQAKAQAIESVFVDKENKLAAHSNKKKPLQQDLFTYSNDQKILDAIEELRQDIASIKDMLNTQQLKESDQLRKAAELITYSANMLEEKERGLS